MTDIDIDTLYQIVIEIITSKEFRIPIKLFISNNCESFYGIEENTIEQKLLHDKFVSIVEDHLHSSLAVCGITDQMFLLAAKKGLEDENYKKYFEEFISLQDYNYFKAMMTKRNLNIQKSAISRMIQEDSNTQNEAKTVLKKIWQKNEEDDLQNAIKLSQVAQEKENQLQQMEEDELKRAIQESLISYKNEPNSVSMNDYKKLVDDKEQKLEEIKKQEKIDNNLKEEEDRKIKQYFNDLKANDSASKPTAQDELESIEKEKNQKLKEYYHSIRQEQILQQNQEQKDIIDNSDNNLIQNNNSTNPNMLRISLRQHLANQLKNRKICK